MVPLYSSGHRRQCGTIPSEKKLANEGITALAEYDNDSSGLQAAVRVMIGKLQMTAGDLAKAKENLHFDHRGEISSKPAPTAYEVHESLYFTTVCDLLSHQVGAAKTSKAALDKWTSSEFRTSRRGEIAQNVIDADLKGFAVGSLLLDWRIDILESDQAKSPAEKTAANTAANHCFRSSRNRTQLRRRLMSSSPSAT